MKKYILSAIAIAFILSPVVYSQNSTPNQGKHISGSSESGVDFALSNFEYSFGADSVSLSFIISNLGDQDFTGWTTCHFVYSIDSTFDSHNDWFHSDSLITHLPGNSSYGISVKRQYRDATYLNPYILVAMDPYDSIPELDETNNMKVIEIPDFNKTRLAFFLAGAPQEVYPGDSIILPVNIENEGRSNSNDYTIKYYLSVDNSLDPTDLLLKSEDMPPLTGFAQITHFQRLAIPANTDPGSYKIFAEIEHLNDLNMYPLIRAIPIYIFEPESEEEVRVFDLEVSVPFGVNYNAPSDTVEIAYTIENLRDSIPGKTIVRYFLSDDDQISFLDIELDTLHLNALDKDGSVQLLDTIILPDELSDGTYAVFIVIDDVQSYTDANQANNSAFIYFIIKNTSIEGTANNVELSVYPNPARSNLYVDSEVRIDGYRIFSSSGQLISRSKDINQNSATISTENMTPGLYYLLIQMDNKTETISFEVHK